MIEIRMPELSASTTEATVVAWMKQVGDRVRVGELIAEVETDKSTVEIEASDDGVLDEILVEAGTEDVAVGTLLARLRAVDADDPVAPAAAEVRSAQSDAPESVAAPASISARAANATRSEPASTAPSPVATSTSPAAESRVVTSTSPAAPSPVVTSASPAAATPLARRMAAQANLDLATLSGSGRDGRIMQSDVVRALGGDVSRAGAVALHAVPPPRKEAAPPPVDEDPRTPGRIERLGAARRTAAQRLTEAKKTLDEEYDADNKLDQLAEGRLNKEAIA